MLNIYYILTDVYAWVNKTKTCWVIGLLKWNINTVCTHLANTVAVSSLDWPKRKNCDTKYRSSILSPFKNKHYFVHIITQEFWNKSYSVLAQYTISVVTHDLCCDKISEKLFPLKPPLTKGWPSPSNSKGSRLGTKQTSSNLYHITWFCNKNKKPRMDHVALRHPVVLILKLYFHKSSGLTCLTEGHGSKRLILLTKHCSWSLLLQ